MGELGFHWPSLIVYLVNFSILLVILYLVAYKPILRVLDQRSNRIQESLEQAEKVQREASEQQTAFERQVADARRESQSQFEEAQQRINQYEQEQRQRADGIVEAELTRARAEIQRERDIAVEELRESFGALAVTAAERIIRRSLDENAHREIINEVLEERDAQERSS